MNSQRLARIATVAPDGRPDVVPVGYEFDGTHIYVGGLDPAKTRRFRNVQAGDNKVALVVDDLVSADPWIPRYLRSPSSFMDPSARRHGIGGQIGARLEHAREPPR
jgi:pyridoxamine 5'-phosphate oxidase family protein